jgi:hypothetical protein
MSDYESDDLTTCLILQFLAENIGVEPMCDEILSITTTLCVKGMIDLRSL